MWPAQRFTTTSTGDGPGLLLVHGSSIDAATNFGGMVKRFAERRTVITPDYAGSGKTAVRPGELTLDLLVDQVLAAAQHAAAGPVDVVGFSLGAVVASCARCTTPGTRTPSRAGRWLGGLERSEAAVGAGHLATPTRCRPRSVRQFRATAGGEPCVPRSSRRTGAGHTPGDASGTRYGQPDRSGPAG
jgi:pimeloyl-ACP methyl ester carboxylesterase